MHKAYFHTTVSGIGGITDSKILALFMTPPACLPPSLRSSQPGDLCRRLLGRGSAIERRVQNEVISRLPYSSSSGRLMALWLSRGSATMTCSA